VIFPSLTRLSTISRPQLSFAFHKLPNFSISGKQPTVPLIVQAQDLRTN
jgi:hypothetical protein